MERFHPAIGKDYDNHGGGTYRCVGYTSDGDPKMQNVASGWTLIAHGVCQYENGTIEWDYSKGGYFEDLTAQQVTKTKR